MGFNSLVRSCGELLEVHCSVDPHHIDAVCVHTLCSARSIDDNVEISIRLRMRGAVESRSVDSRHKQAVAVARIGAVVCVFGKFVAAAHICARVVCHGVLLVCV